MNIEVEVKCRLDDARAFEKRLIRAGARRTKEVFEQDTYYSHPGRDFSMTDEALRIRRAGKWADLTYKGPKLDRMSKSREEIVVPLGGPDMAKKADALLRRLGFGKVANVRKRRRLYVQGKFVICVDRVEGLGDFVEVEASSPKKGYKRILDEEFLLLGGLGGNEPERRSYLEMLLARRKTKKRGNR